ncbi:MAG TPA: glycosyltransferase [Solirubrobacteraceae bacterium]|nr:glycosyltransferase [Solirubrobacteraceae bacterium]
MTRPQARRLRVLSLIDRASGQGGAERFAVGLATHLPRERFEAWICSSREPDGATAAAVAETGIPLVTLGRRAKWDAHRMRGLAELLRRERFDVLHAHKFGSNLWGTVIGRACRVPVVIAHEHTWTYEGDPLRIWLDGNVTGRLATRYVAVSAADRERMVRIEGVNPDKVTVIPATVHIPSLAGPGAGDVRAELGLALDTPVIAIVAVLRPQKALTVLLEAHALVLDRIPGAHLVIAGDGRCRQELEQRSRELGLDGKVHFLGRRSDVDAILAAADVAALSSDFEGTPLFIAECMANHTPVVATAVGGVPEVIEDGRTGLLVPPRDPAALADGLTRLLADPSERRRIADEAYRRSDRFTLDAVAARFGELYETLAAAKRK